MLRIFTLIIILSCAGWFLYSVRPKAGLLKNSLRIVISGAKDSLVKLTNPRSLRFTDAVVCVRLLSYFIAAVSALLLAFSGFIPYLISGGPLTGFMLMLHVSVSPVFAVSMTAACLLWAHEHLFTEADTEWFIVHLFRRKERGGAHSYRTGRKICFWLLIILTPLITGSIILSLYPFFGTGSLNSLLTIHLMSALLFFAVGIVHAYLVLHSVKSESNKNNTS
ncbi:hypothetical protein ACFL4Q_00960 [candidate division KSB1 bacterium]